jgi:hypothetical protein
VAVFSPRRCAFDASENFPQRVPLHDFFFEQNFRELLQNAAVPT